ncbi:MAG TPA: hypothetical protein VMQ51_05735 [Candidatus Binatia bacterium]|nr:hypothetical protein [Candidatus Binatia bacterium]
MVKQAHEDLGRRLSALRADFAALGTRAADAASALAAKLPPPPALLDELSAARDAFAELRDAMVEHAGTLALVLDGERLGNLRDLEPVLAAIGAAEERQAQLQAWEEARESALVALDRVMALIHREERGFGALAECQARARELHGALSGSTPDDIEHETVMISAKLRPFAELLALVDGWNALDDDRCAFLQDAITQSFGRPLALAALRGKLGREGELPPPAPEPRGRGRAAAGEPAYPAAVYSPSGGYAPPAYPAPAYAAPAAADAGARPAAPGGGAPAYPAGAPAYPAGTPVYPAGAPAYAVGAPGVAAAGGAPAGGVPGVPGGVVVTGGTPGVVVTGGGAAGGAAGGGVLMGGGGPVVAGGGGSLVVEIRLSGDKINVETPEARKEREELLERLAQETAQWWIAARNGWNAMHERGAVFADGAYDFLHRFPTLLSVPLQKSAEAESGGVAEGYALLLAHIEKQEEGFVREALTRLNPQFTTREKDKSYPLGQELYLYVVAEGRLYKTYPDFVKEVLVHALPQAGPWVQGGLIESDDETRRFTRAETLGSTEERTETVTGWKERIGPHVFTVTTGPLTTRFFTLRLTGDTLADPPDVEIKLKENDAPTDHAWLVTLPMPGKVQPLAPRKHRTGGTTLPGLGRDFSGLWIGVFNADPSNERSYELTITLRRKPPTEAPKTIKPPAQNPLAGKFFGKKR